MVGLTDQFRNHLIWLKFSPNYFRHIFQTNLSGMLTAEYYSLPTHVPT